MTPERTELIVNLNVLPEPPSEFVLAHFDDFQTPLPAGLCEQRYVHRVHVAGLLLTKYTPQRILNNYSGRAFAKFGVTVEGILCLRFLVDWPERESILVGFADTLTDVNIHTLLNDTTRMLCYLGRGATSETFFQPGFGEPEPVTSEEFVTFAESFISDIIALTAENTENTGTLGGFGDMSWLSPMLDNGTIIEKDRSETS